MSSELQFINGSGWRACFDENSRRYFGEYGGTMSYHLYELTKEQYEQLDSDMTESDASKIMYEGRHLYMSVDDRCGPPYTIVFDSDYEKLCPWAKARKSGKVWPDELTDAVVELFESEKNNREQRREKRKEREKKTENSDYQAENMILHFVTEDDLAEVARTWPSDHHPLSDTQARETIAYMIGNYKRNTKGCIYHLCLAVCSADNPHTIMGWCGLDGRRNHTEPEIFILLDEPYRGKGYGTLCVKELLRIAVEDYMLAGVHGGCAKENIASARAMEKGGMVQYGTEENGDPLFRFTAKEKTFDA